MSDILTITADDTIETVAEKIKSQHPWTPLLINKTNRTIAMKTAYGLLTIQLPKSKKVKNGRTRINSGSTRKRASTRRKPAKGA